MSHRPPAQSSDHPDSPTARRQGFTLIEMVVVIAVISILLTAAGPVIDHLASSQSPAAAAAVIAGQLERARSHAIAKDTYVWVRLGQVAEEPNDFFIGVYGSLDGTDHNTSVRGIWSVPRIPDFKLSNALGSSLIRPPVPSAAQVNEAAWVRFSPAGEARVIPAVAAESRLLLKPPADPGVMRRWTELGLQATRRGQVPASLKKDVAAIQLNGLTGQALEFTR